MKNMKLLIENFNKFLKEEEEDDYQKAERLYTDNWENALEDEDDKEELNPNKNPYGKEIQFAHSQLRSLLNKNKNPSEDEIIIAIQDGWEEGRREKEDLSRYDNDYDDYDDD